MDKVKPIHAIVALCLLVATTTAGFVLWFTPITYAEETRQLVMQLTAKQQLKWMSSELNELEWYCTDKLTDEWVCSDKKRTMREELILDVNVIRNELGLPLLEEGNP